jgi:hypothetical protein
VPVGSPDRQEKAMQKTVAAADLGKRFRAVLKQPEDEVLRRFDEVRARIGERTAGFSEEEVAADVAAARQESLR